MTLEVHPQAKGLIFDLDGTLADTMAIHYEAIMRVSQEEGFVFNKDLFYEMAGVPTIRIVDTLNERQGLQLDAQYIELKKEQYYFELAKRGIKPIAPVFDIAHAYKGKLPMACGTGSIRKAALLTLQACDMNGFFDVLVTAEDVKNPKPAPDTFLACAEKMGIPPEFCQVFEDGDPGLTAAEAAGMIATDVRPVAPALV